MGSIITGHSEHCLHELLREETGVWAFVGPWHWWQGSDSEPLALERFGAPPLSLGHAFTRDPAEILVLPSWVLGERRLALCTR